MFAEGEAEEHFQAGAVAITHQRIFDWLDILLKSNFLVFYLLFFLNPRNLIRCKRS